MRGGKGRISLRRTKGERPPRSPSGLISGGIKCQAKGRMLYPFGNYAKYYSSRRRCVSSLAMKAPLCTAQAGASKLATGTRLQADIRLRAVNEALPTGLQGHVVLDIGCNEGILPLEMTSLYSVNWVEGVDIDIQLIKNANRTLREIRRQVIATMALMLQWEDDHLTDEQMKQDHGQHEQWLGLISQLEMILPQRWDLAARILSGDAANGAFPFNVNFLPENLVLDSSRERAIQRAYPLECSRFTKRKKDSRKELSEIDPCVTAEFNSASLQSQWSSMPSISSSSTLPSQLNLASQPVSSHETQDARFTLITMFSVIKWIHVAYGDGHVKRMFRKVYNLLEPEGFYVLEPQNQRSYQNADKVLRKTGKLSQTRTIGGPKRHFRPADFDNYLVKAIGFKRHAVILFQSDERDPNPTKSDTSRPPAPESLWSVAEENEDASIVDHPSDPVTESIPIGFQIVRTGEMISTGLEWEGSEKYTRRIFIYIKPKATS